MKKFDCIVIGGGLSGIVSAIELAKNNKKVCILEANSRIGKKILASGNGKCNILNKNLSKDKYNTDFVQDCLIKYPIEDLINYYEDLGLILRISEDKYYPYSESANTVLNILLLNLKKYNVSILENEKVISIEKENNFIVKTKNNIYSSQKVILASGSKATFGVESYSLISDLGHKSTKLVQSLVPIKIFPKIGANGVRCKVRATLFINEEEIIKEDGEILFKDGYLSGILAFRLSTYIARAIVQNTYKSAKVNIDFVPSIDEKELEKFFNKINNIENALLGIVHKAIAQFIIKEKNIVHSLKNFSFKVDGLGPIENAQVMSGGLLVEQFDSKTFESKLVKGLYAVGEVLDVDGECGGYNLSFALISALCAAKSIIGDKC